MECPNCKNLIKPNYRFCVNCGTKLTKKRFTKKFGIIALIVVIFFIALVSVYESPTSKIVGEWTTDAGMDSQHFHFKSNEDLVWYDMFEKSRDSYCFNGKTLSINSDEKYGGRYEYSERAKGVQRGAFYADMGDTEYWYIESFPPPMSR